MGIFDFFRRKPAVRDVVALADFIDQQAAFLAQKGIYDYARARSGHYAKVLLKEAEFQAACDVARWQTFPISLAMVGEVAESVLVPVWPSDRGKLNEAIREITLSVMDRYPAPKALESATWARLRDELDLHLRHIALHPPKQAIDIAEPFWQRYFDLMPIHQELRTRDELTTRGYLRVTLCNIHDELTKRMEADGLVVALQSSTTADVVPR